MRRNKIQDCGTTVRQSLQESSLLFSYFFLLLQLLSATKSRKKQQAEAVQSVIHAEAEKRRKERENFHITTVPILVRAAHEPSLYNGTSEEHEDDEVNQDQEKVR